MVIYASPIPSTSAAIEGRIFVDESDYRLVEEKLPFVTKGVVRIRAKEKFSNFYECFDVIGEGKFGKVYRCQEKATGLELAAKRIKIKRDADREQVEKEVAIMTQMRHPRIAQIYDAFSTPENDIVLVMEVVPGGELFDRVVQENYILTELAVVMIISQLCEAVEYIHSKHIVHLDIKPENIMCVSQTSNRIKLIDFGLAQYYDGSTNLLFMAGTPEFVAPEVIKFEPIDFHTDMWSIGVITYVLLSGISPFLGETLGETYCAVEKGDWEFDEECFEGISEAAKDFISKLLILNQKERMLPADCLQHNWIIQARARIACQSPVCEPDEGKPISKESLRNYIKNQRFRRATWAVLFLMRFKRFGNVNWTLLNKMIDQEGKKVAGSARTSRQPAAIEKCSSVQCDITLRKEGRIRKPKQKLTVITNEPKKVEKPTTLSGSACPTVAADNEVQKKTTSSKISTKLKKKLLLSSYSELGAQTLMSVREHRKCYFTCCKKTFKVADMRKAKNVSASKVFKLKTKQKLHKTILLKKAKPQQFLLHRNAEAKKAVIIWKTRCKNMATINIKLLGKRTSRSFKTRSLIIPDSISKLEAVKRSTDLNNNATTSIDNSADKTQRKTSLKIINPKKMAQSSTNRDEKENPTRRSDVDKNILNQHLQTLNQPKKSRSSVVLKTLNDQNGAALAKTRSSQNITTTEITKNDASTNATKESYSEKMHKTTTGGENIKFLQEMGTNLEVPVLGTQLISSNENKSSRPKFKNAKPSDIMETGKLPVSDGILPSASQINVKERQNNCEEALFALTKSKEIEFKESDEKAKPQSINATNESSKANEKNAKNAAKVSQPYRKAKTATVFQSSKDEKSQMLKIPIGQKDDEFRSSIRTTKKFAAETLQNITAIDTNEQKQLNGNRLFKNNEIKVNKRSIFKNPEEAYICTCNFNSIRKTFETIKADEKTVREPTEKNISRKKQAAIDSCLVINKVSSQIDVKKVPSNERLASSSKNSSVRNDTSKKNTMAGKTKESQKLKTVKAVKEDIAQFRLSDGKSTEGIKSDIQAECLKPDRVQVRDEDYETESKTSKKDSSKGLNGFEWLKNKFTNRSDGEETSTKNKSDTLLHPVSNARRALNMWRSIEKSNSATSTRSSLIVN